MTTMEKVEAGFRIQIEDALLRMPPVRITSGNSGNKKKPSWFRNISRAIQTEITVLVAELIALTSNCQEQL